MDDQILISKLQSALQSEFTFCELQWLLRNQKQTNWAFWKALDHALDNPDWPPEN